MHIVIGIIALYVVIVITFFVGFIVDKLIDKVDKTPYASPKIAQKTDQLIYLGLKTYAFLAVFFFFLHGFGKLISIHL